MQIKKTKINRNHLPQGNSLNVFGMNSLKQGHPIYLERSLVISLLLFIAVFEIFKHAPNPRQKLNQIKMPECLYVENVPVTRQKSFAPRPSRPVVSIPTEEANVPENITIAQSIYLNASGVSAADIREGERSLIPPRPVAEVWPAYPKEERKRGIEGEIELALQVDTTGQVVRVLTLKNTTKSERCKKAAIEAAYKTRFLPGRQGNKSVTAWVNKTYKFSLEK